MTAKIGNRPTYIFETTRNSV